jgi:hypothetical protein
MTEKLVFSILVIVKQDRFKFSKNHHRHHHGRNKNNNVSVDDTVVNRNFWWEQ